MMRRTSIDRRDDPAARASLLVAALCAALAIGAAPAWADEIESEPMVMPSSPDADADADATSEPSDDDWQFEIAPYGWFIFIDGTVASSEVSLSFGDVWDDLHFAFMLDTEIRKRDFVFFTDLAYSYLWQRNDGPLAISLSSKMRLVLFDFAFSYEALKLNLGSRDGAPRLRLQPYVGGRYVYLSLPTNVRIPLLPDRKIQPTSNTVAPILGLRGFLDINDRWNMSFAGDGGGFGVDNMDVTWQAELLGGYRFHHSKFDLNLMIGYKGVGLDNGDDGIDTDLKLHGPVLKLGIEF